MSDISENISLPPGWDTKYDFRTGKRYYVNHFTKHTSLEDPRMRYRKLQAGEAFSFQSYHSSPARSASPQPFYHMHQDINYSSGRPSPIIGGRSYSPLMGSNALHYLTHKPHEYPTVETSVSKIKALFPTVSETHIKALLHKYHYRETVVMSALQVEKHPLTTPGPYSSPLATARNVLAQIASAPGSPGRFSFASAFKNLSPRRTPRSSPKMKLRYLKNVFPKVEETVLLDTLSNSENNVNKATETLLTMGFIKKDMYKCDLKKMGDSEKTDLKFDNVYIPLRDPDPKLKTVEERSQIRKRLEDKFEKISAAVILLALETADYDEERAEHFLNATMNDKKKPCFVECGTSPLKVIPKEETELKNIHANDNNEPKEDFRDSGIWEKTSPNTPDELDGQCEVAKPSELPKFHQSVKFFVESEISKKKNDTFLSRTGIKLRAKIIPKGPNKELLGTRIVSKGPNKDLAKGPQKGLATGSMYSSASTKKNSHHIKHNNCTII